MVPGRALDARVVSMAHWQVGVEDVLMVLGLALDGEDVLVWDRADLVGLLGILELARLDYARDSMVLELVRRSAAW